MNVFRIGLNLIVVIALVNVRPPPSPPSLCPAAGVLPLPPLPPLQIDYLSQDTVFLFTVILLTLAVLCQHRLFGLSEQNVPVESEGGSRGGGASHVSGCAVPSPPPMSTPALSSDRSSVADGEDLSAATVKTDASA